MKWSKPPIIKVYEALGSIADGRIEVSDNTAKVFSSSKGKYYTVTFDPDANAIMCNDNGSYYVGYLGYPAIAFLMKIGKLKFSEEFAQALKGIKWKDLNQQFKNDFSKTLEHIHNGLLLKGETPEELKTFCEEVLAQINELNPGLLGEKTRPPKGY